MCKTFSIAVAIATAIFLVFVDIITCEKAVVINANINNAQ